MHAYAQRYCVTVCQRCWPALACPVLRVVQVRPVIESMFMDMDQQLSVDTITRGGDAGEGVRI